MSQFRVPVVQISKVGKHPNADTLSITQVEGCPVIFRTGDYQPGDLAVYVPVDSVVPLEDERFSFLKTREGQIKARVKAKKLRGIFSMGLLIRFDGQKLTFGEHGGCPILSSVPENLLGIDMREALKIEKYEEATPIQMNTGNESCPWFMPVYDMESYRKYKDILVPGEEVVVTEKIHGCNGRFMFKDRRLWVGSHRTVKLRDEKNLWWQVAVQEKLEEGLARWPGIALYGEVYGNVQDLKYGAKPGEVKFAAFDALDTEQGRWLDHDELQTLIKDLGIASVPVLYRGPYIPEAVEPLAEGKSTLAGHIREGFVIRPIRERPNDLTSRTVLKLVSEAYLLRKDGTEHH